MSRLSPQATVSGVFVGVSVADAMNTAVRRLRGDARFVDIEVGVSSIGFTNDPRSPLVTKSQYSLRFGAEPNGTKLSVTVQSTGMAVGDFFGFYRRMAEEMLRSLDLVPDGVNEGETPVENSSVVRPVHLAAEYAFISLIGAAAAYLLSGAMIGVVSGITIVALVLLTVVFWRRRARLRQKSSARSGGAPFDL